MVTAATWVRSEELDPERRNSTAHDFEERLKRKVVGQYDAVQAIVDLYQVFCAHLNPSSRPIGNLLFLGPTGTGRARVVEATAEVLFGDPRALIDDDFHDFEPGWRGNHRADERRNGFCAGSAGGHASAAGRRGGANGEGSGQAEICAGVHEPDRQGRGVPTLMTRRIDCPAHAELVFFVFSLQTTKWRESNPDFS
jgi:hypothetical protein